MLILIYASVAQLDRAQDSDSWCRGFKSCQTRHVGAKFALLRFSLQEKHPLASLLLLFRKKSRSAHLFGCKRPYDGSLSLPTFCELRGFNSHRRNAENIFFMWLIHVVASYISLAATFLQKSPARLFRCLPSCGVRLCLRQPVALPWPTVTPTNPRCIPHC